MLPFLKPKPQTGIIVETRKSDGGSKPDESEENHGLTACAEDLIRAVHAKDAKAVASALQAAFEVCESYPHEEGEHTNESPSPHTFEAQNIKAAGK